MHKKSEHLNKLAGLQPASTPPSMDKYRVQDALSTIARAEEFKRDRSLMREVKKMAKSQVKAVCK